MAKIIKTITGEAMVVIKETYIDEDAAASEENEPETRDVTVTDFKVENTKWRKEYDK